MRSVLASSLLLAQCVSGCAQTWGVGERPEPAPSPASAVVPSDAETDRLADLAGALEEELASLTAQLDRGERTWAEQDAEAVKKSLAAQQDLLERRLVLSVALANVRAAIAGRREALGEAGDPGPIPAREPIPDSLDAVIRQAEQQVRGARDRRDAEGGDAFGRLPVAPPIHLFPKTESKDRAPRDDARRDEGTREAAAVVEGPPARVDLQKALVPHFDALSACVPKSADVERVIVRGRLTADGRLRELRVVEGVAIPAVVGCLTDRLEAITVTMPAGAVASVVTFPLHFGGR